MEQKASNQSELNTTSYLNQLIFCSIDSYKQKLLTVVIKLLTYNSNAYIKIFSMGLKLYIYFMKYTYIRNAIQTTYTY